MARHLAFALALLVVACMPSPAPATPDPTPSAVPLGVPLTITGSGQVSCPTPYGCRPSLVIQADPTGASPESEPVWTVQPGEEISFPSEMTSDWTVWDVGRTPIDPPATIHPGRYRLAGVVNLVYDLGSPVPSPAPVQVAPRCFGEVIVAADLVSVLVSVQFDSAGGCTMGTGVGID